MKIQSDFHSGLHFKEAESISSSLMESMTITKSVLLDKKKKESFFPNMLTLVQLILLCIEDIFNVKWVKDGYKISWEQLITCWPTHLDIKLVLWVPGLAKEGIQNARTPKWSISWHQSFTEQAALRSPFRLKSNSRSSAEDLNGNHFTFSCSDILSLEYLHGRKKILIYIADWIKVCRKGGDIKWPWQQAKKIPLRALSSVMFNKDMG